MSPHHLVLGLPLLHQIPLVLPDSGLIGIVWIFRVWAPLRKHVLSASTQDHLEPEIRAGGLGAWLALYSSHTAPTSPARSVGKACPHLLPLHSTLGLDFISHMLMALSPWGLRQAPAATCCGMDP